MKALLTNILCASLVLQSCSSYYAVTGMRGEELLQRGDKEIQISLQDGVEIVVQAHRYILTTQPDSFYYGLGERFNTITGERESFQGVVYPSRVNTGSRVTYSSWGENKVERLYCWIDDTVRVEFRETDYVHVTPEGGRGLFIPGREQSIPRESIVSVSEKKIDPVKTLLIGVVVVGGVAFLAIGTVAVALSGLNRK